MSPFMAQAFFQLLLLSLYRGKMLPNLMVVMDSVGVKLQNEYSSHVLTNETVILPPSGGASCFGDRCTNIHPYPDGGENGSSGIGPPVPVGDHPSRPGLGTWEDLSGYHMKYFHLAPGRGGKAYYEPSLFNGGGGGGVLINGEGPEHRSNDGEGYGGGGGGNHPGFYSGLGVVLLEIDTQPLSS